MGQLYLKLKAVLRLGRTVACALAITCSPSVNAADNPSPVAYLGTQPGPQTVSVLPVSPVENTNAEWFGALPWWQWSRLTGDWGAIRPRLENEGMAFGGRSVVDTSAVLGGGTARRGMIRELLDLNLTLDLQPLLKLEGGTFYAQFFSRQGPRGVNIAGDLQGFDNMDARDLNQAEELWYEQKYFQGMFRTKIGQVDANAEFDSVGAASEFIHSSAGYSPTILGCPTYPNPALSANLFVYPAGWFYWGGGVYTGNFRELSGTRFEHPFLISEMGVKFGPWRWLGPGRLAAGIWQNTGTAERFDGSGSDSSLGFYALAEQTIWKRPSAGENDSQGISAFVQYGQADPALCAFEHQVGLGLSAVGLLPSRNRDATGIYLTWANTSRAAGAGLNRNETALELFYKYQVTPFFSLKPDVQWIRYPGGQALPDRAWVATLRVIILF